MPWRSLRQLSRGRCPLVAGPVGGGHAIGNLENQLRIALFDRSSHRPTLTSEGRTLLPMCAPYCSRSTPCGHARLASARASSWASQSLSTPSFRSGLPPRRSKIFVAYIRRSQRPVRTAPLGAAIAALREGQCALAITAADLPEPRIELEAMSFVPRAAVAAATHALPCVPGLASRHRGRTGGPPPDCGAGPISADRRARLRRAVSRHVASSDNATKHA